MKVKLATGVRRCLAALIVPCVFSGSLAIADTVTLAPVALGSAQDNPANDDVFPDGQYDAMQAPDDPLYVWKYNDFTSYREYRTLFEFALPPELLELGVSIHRATLVAPLLGSSWGPGSVDTVSLHGYAADATLALEDFGVTNLVAEAPQETAPSDSNHRFEVATYLLSLAGTGNGRVGFVGAIGQWMNQVIWAPDATLQVEYSPASPTLPGLSVISPSQDAQYLDGSEITLRARASDVQDGNVDEFIKWEIPVEGSVWEAIGGDQTVLLPTGTYQVKASVMDSDGNVVTHVRNVTVVPIPGSNLPPTLTIVSPIEGMDLLAGISTPFQATALDPEDGDLSERIQWLLDNNDLGRGGSISTTLTPGPHVITAIVSDNGARRAFKEFNVNVLPAVNYCAAGGYPNARYWIAQVAMNGASRLSGGNGGYADFTGTWFQAVKGTNTILLTSDGGAWVYWTVWIDLNRDGVFSDDEALARTRANSTTARGLAIPTSAITGVTRMRVSLRQSGMPAACGVADSGETEDYTVVIQ